MAATTSNKVFEELMVKETARSNIPSQCAGLGGQGVAIGAMRFPPLASVRRTVPASLRGSFHSEKTAEEKTRRKPGFSLMKRRARKSSHSGTQVVGKSLSIGSGFNGADSSYSSPGILDVYGIKTKPVDLMPYMAEISLKDLLTEEYRTPQPIHEILKTRKKDSKDSFYPEANRILQCCLKWPGKAALPREVDAGATLNTIDRGQCSVDPGHASKFSSQAETHVFAKNSVEILSMKPISCSKVTGNVGFLKAGALVSGNPDLQDDQEKNAFSVNSLPLKPFGDCVKSLKLSDCESLDNLIAQLNGSRIVDWSIIAGCSNKQNGETIPPFPFSHRPVWTLKADVVHERSIMKGKSVEVRAIKQMNDSKEPLQEDSSEYYFSNQLKGGKETSSRSVKHQARQVLQGPTSLTDLEHCCDEHLSHVSSSMPVEVIPPEAFTAACILFHMANELPFPLGTADKKNGRRSLQTYPGVPCQRPAKSLNVGPSAAVPCHIKNKQGDAINKPNRSLTPSKFPLGERKKSLSLVGDAVITPANLPVRTIPRCTGGIPSAPLSTTGVSGANRFLMWSEKDGQISSRGNNRVSGRGPAPCIVSPPTKTGLKTVLKSSRKA